MGVVTRAIMLGLWVSFVASGAAAQVVLNEIHYHPSNATVQPGEDAERLQFLELYNMGAGAVDLSGWFFPDGISYTFPTGTQIPGHGFLVLAKDPAFLAQRGPAVPPSVQVLKWTAGDLANGGEKVTLADPTGKVQDQVVYEDAGLWPSEPDGLGPSLELTNPVYDKSYPLVWRASKGTNGTPGAKNSTFTEGPIVLFEEPARKSVVGALTEVAVTFAEPVSGVSASMLVVDGSPAQAVSCSKCAGGVGAGPYVFSGFAAPKSNPFIVKLEGAIKDAEGHVFAGDSWQYFQSVPKIVINEIHYNPASSTDDEEFIELYNADSVAVDVSGWKLVEFASPGCVFGPGTVMQPGQYLVCARNPAALKAATGYETPWSYGTNDSLSNGGEPIALLNADGTVVDRVEYDDDPPWPAGPSSPDGYGPSLELINPYLDNAQGQFWRASKVTNGTPGAKNSTFGEAPVVASEDPVRGSVVVSLPTVSVTFSKPVTGVTPDDLEVDGVPATNVVGSGAGPYIFAVPGVGQGQGSVISLVLNAGGIADADGRPFAGDKWMYFKGLPRLVINEIHYHPATSAVAAGQDPEDLQFIELYNADGAEVDLGGYAFSQGISMVFPAGTKIAGLGYLVVARNPTFLASKVQIPAGVPVLAWGGGQLGNGGDKVRLVDPYGHAIDEVEYGDKGDWPAEPDGKGPSLELINPALPNDQAGAWKASLVTNGTPGKANSVFAAAPAPIIFGVKHFPPIPKGGQSVTVTARVVDESAALPAVTLRYRQDQDPPIAYSATPMLDDGQHGDGEAGDGVFGAVVPGLADGQQLDFYIEASDGKSTSVAPAGHAVNDSHGNPSQTFLCKFSNEVLPTDFPVYHIIVTRVNKRFQEAATTEMARKTPYDATFIDDKGNIFYNVTERYRGQSSIFKFPSSYTVDFPPNRKLDSALGFKVRKLQLNGMRPMAQYLGYDLFNRAGMPAPKVAFARLRYTGINYDVTNIGQNGFYGVYAVVERMDDDFLDSQGGQVPDRGLSSEGNLYRGKNDANLRWEGTDPKAYYPDANEKNGYVKYNNETLNQWDDLIGLVDALNNSSPERYVEHVKAHVDEDNWARYFALMMLMGNREGGIYLDTGDDYFLWFRPLNDPKNPPHPDYGTPQLPADRRGNDAKLMPWDLDSVLFDADYSIWRTTVPAVQQFLRHNAFAPIFVKAIEDFANGPFSPATMNAVIDAMPPQVFGTKDGSDKWPETKQQFKNWIANRVAYVLNETVDNLTLDGAPESPYEGLDPLLHLSGRLKQAGTHLVTVNGQPANFSVYQATWSYDLTLQPGYNVILVQAWDRDGKELQRIERPVYWNPPGSSHIRLELRSPRRMINNRTLTIEARIVDEAHRIVWTVWDELGKVSVVRLPDRTPVGTTNTVFDPHVPVPDDSIRFINGWGSVSFTLDDGANYEPGDIEVTVEWKTLKASRVVTVLANPQKRSVSGTLTGANLTWGPDEVIRVAGNCTVPAGSTLVIKPGTLVEVATTGTLENGTLITVQGNLQAIGARDNPIFFFSERGPAAMKLTQSGSASNGDAWRGFQFFGAGSSVMRYVFLTGAGNGNVVSHPRPPILGMFSTHSLTSEYNHFADNCGMVFSGQGTGKYVVRRSLVTRAGIGCEFFGNGHTLEIRDTWWTSIGRAPEANNLDGDALHVDGANSKQLIRSCIVNDGGDDGIDHSNSSFTLAHSIITGIRDKAVSMTGGHINADNVLIFGCGSGIRGFAATDHVTIATSSPIASVDRVYRSIIWPSSIATCSGKVDYTLVGKASDLGCGEGNLSKDPKFVDAANKNYDLQKDSVARTAGPDQDRIGWLGFPYGAVCKSDADCNDENWCTKDTCVNKECVFTPIPGCQFCETDVDCDDGEPCTSDVCAYDGSCSHPLAPDGTACDDHKACTSPDRCTAGVCGGPENCPANQHCDETGACVGGGGEPVTVSFQDGVAGYSGTHDTFLMEAQPDTVKGAVASMWWDLEDPKPMQEVALIRFADIYGTKAGQIMPGATIAKATLTLYIQEGYSGPAGSVHEAWVQWDEALATWNNFGGEPGYQPDEYGPQVAAAPTAVGFADIDVTAQIQAWAFSPSSNNGWIFIPASANHVRAATSEHPTVAWRPKLTVTYYPPTGGCVSDEACDNGKFCDGKEKCDLATGKCIKGAPVDCNDGIDCTTDSCNEAAARCDHLAVDAVCDDNNACTNDVCDQAKGCQNTPKPPCDDHIPCTTDKCDPTAGCVFEDACGPGLVCDVVKGQCEKGPTTVSFQDGVAGYEGTVDTYLDAGNPDADNSIITTLVVDGTPPKEEERQVLLRFDNIFGDGPGQIPPGSPIVSAKLTIFITNPSEDGAELHRMLEAWTDKDTWNSMGNGVQVNGVEAVEVPDASGSSNSNRVAFVFDVTLSLVAWSAGEPNYGWVFVMPSLGTDSWQFSSSEELEIAERPLLTVQYIPCDPGYKGDGVECHDVDECKAPEYPCDVNATCENKEGSYECKCKSGWKGDGKQCEDIDECAEGVASCDQHALCQNLPGSYDCHCNEGYEGDGHVCSDVNECAATPGPCDLNADCKNLEGTYECTCREGFVGDGHACGECPGGHEHPCNGHGGCGGTADAPKCTCDDGFEGPDCADCKEGLFGPDCTKACPGGSENPCNDHGECSDGTSGTGECTCNEAFDGEACDHCKEGYFAYPDCTKCPECSDGNICTDDSCDTGVGCVHTPNASKCDDNDPCTKDDTCANGACVGVPVVCEDDGDECTLNVCDKATGMCVAVPNPACVGPDATTAEDGLPDTAVQSDAAEGALPDGADAAVGDEGVQGEGVVGPDAPKDNAGGEALPPDQGIADKGPLGDVGGDQAGTEPGPSDDIPWADLTMPDGVTPVKVGGGGGCTASGGLALPFAPLLLTLVALLRRRRRE